MKDTRNQAALRIEEVFEHVREREYANMPSRKNCLFLFDFDLDPDRYAASMLLIEVRRELNLVEVVCDPAKSNVVSVKKSLLTLRFTEGELQATDDELVLDAHRYWSETTRSDYDTEVLLYGEFKYARIMRRAEDPLDARLRRFEKERILAGRNRLADLLQPTN